MNNIFIIVCIFLLIPFCVSGSYEKKSPEPKSSLKDKIVRLTSFKKKPYTGESLKEKGVSAYIVTQVFKKMGYTVRVTFLSEEEAVTSVSKEKGSDGYFPDYYSKEKAKEFICSASLGDASIGLLELKEKSVNWEKLEDLKNYTIGVTAGSAVTQEFDELVKKSTLKVEKVLADRLNILKVAGKKIPLAIIDKNALDYLLQEEFKNKKLTDLLQFNKKNIETKKLSICFKKGAQGEHLEKIFSEGLKKVDLQKIEADYKSLKN